MIELSGPIPDPDRIESLMDEHGAVMLRGAGAETMEDFVSIVDRLGLRRQDYRGGNSPRTHVGDQVYTSTEYSAAQPISLHNELSYAKEWPERLVFGCITPASSGGATTVADGRKVLAALSETTVDAFATRGVQYVSNLHGGAGPGRSWQQTYETEDPAEVERFCAESGSRHEWLEDGSLRVIRNGPGVITHPRTGERAWFNQAEQFHPTSLPEPVAEFLLEEYAGREEELPQWASYGDGVEIPLDVLEEIRTVLDTMTLAPAWHAGDVLVVDNLSTMHGRLAFDGERRVLVAIG